MFQVLPGPIEEILAVLEYWDHIFSGFLLTLWLYGWAILIGFFLGLMLAILRHYKLPYPLGIIYLCRLYRDCAWHTSNRTIISFIFSPL